MQHHILQRVALSARHYSCHTLRRAKLSPSIYRLDSTRTAYNQATPPSGPSPGTYFQAPPVQKPKLRWRILRGSIYCFVAAVAGAYYTLTTIGDKVEALQGEIADALDDNGATLHSTAKLLAREISYFNVAPGAAFQSISTETVASSVAITHIAQASSNFPGEDMFCIEALALEGSTDADVMIFGIFDGHAGSIAARIVRDILPQYVMARLGNHHGYPEVSGTTLKDQDFRDSMEVAFLDMDKTLLDQLPALQNGQNVTLRAKMSAAIQADSGTCAVLSLYDAHSSRLHVANVGDSRAVLGRWDASLGKYIAMPLTNDHTGFNQSEVDRLAREHPGEKCIDEKTGRLFGLAVTRAFGDARWKWPADLMEFAYRHLFTNSPRPNGVIKTPPYLTSLPEVTHVEIQQGEHPDFLITASDGLWDQLSSDQAVDLVQLWLNKFTPADQINRVQAEEKRLQAGIGPGVQDRPDYTAGETNLDLYFDEKDKSIKWKNDQSHWIVERAQCGEHLIQNALGGDRKELFDTLMSIPPSHSRNVRDDITVTVVFFAADISQVPRELILKHITT